MTGGLLQLVSVGSQDLYITGNPQLTFFKTVYKRHTNFSMESMENTFTSNPAMGKKISCPISRRGDLLYKTYLELHLQLGERMMDTSKNAKMKYIPISQETTVSDTVLRINDGSGNQYIPLTNQGNLSTPIKNYFNDPSVASSVEGPLILNTTSNKVSFNNKQLYTSTGNELMSYDIDSLLKDHGILPTKSRLGYRIIDYVEINVGGQTLDRQYGEWMDIWCQLSHTAQEYDKLMYLLSENENTYKSGLVKLHIPLQFWFCRNPGLAIPLVALQYHEVVLDVYLNDFSNLKEIHTYRLEKDNSLLNVSIANNQMFTYQSTNNDIHVITEAIFYTTRSLMIEKASVWCDYIFLDTEERRRFAKDTHDYLIEQIQFSQNILLESGNVDLPLRFNHPVKEIVWILQTPEQASFKNYHYWNASGKDLVNTAVLRFNGSDRFIIRPAIYFRSVQMYQHHSGGSIQSPVDSMGGFYLYSFALNPEKPQPCGTCNFSKIDSVSIYMNTSENSISRAYAMAYNVFHIEKGMGGMIFGN